MAGDIALRCALAATVLSIGAAAAQTITYSDSSSPEKLQSRVGIGIGQEGLALGADMTLVGEHGETRVLPRVTSSWTTLDFLDVNTVIAYDDWNRTADPFRPTVSANLLITSEVPFVERVEAELRRSDSTSNESLNLALNPMDTGLRLFGGDPLGIDADLALRSSGEQLTTTSSVTSSWGLGAAVDVKSVLRLEDGAASGPTSSALDTTLVYETPLAFIDALEGRIYRSDATGASRQSVAILFPEMSSGGQHGTSFKLASKAIVGETLRPNGLEAMTMGVETKLSGLLPPLLGGSNALSFKVERMLDSTRTQSSTLAYDHAWSPGDASIGLNLKVLSDPEDVEPSMGVSWSTAF